MSDESKKKNPQYKGQEDKSRQDKISDQKPDNQDKNQTELLQKLLIEKESEIQVYRKELFKISYQLDEVMSKISTDVDALKKIHKALVPTEIPNMAGFEFSRKFLYGSKTGGDYFDIFEHEDRLKFGILLSSSSGYAMSALFLSLVLKVSHLIEAKKGLSPDKVIEKISTELKDIASSKDHAHVFYGVVDRRNYTLNLCVVGQIHGFLQSPTEPLKLISSSSDPLGPQFSPTFKSISVDLESKARLVLVSDGITKVLSIDEISKLLTNQLDKLQVHDVRNELLYQCQKKTGLENPISDQTVVVMDVKDRVIKLAK